MRTFRTLPVAGTDEDFAVALALFTMKLVNRHAGNVAADVSRLKFISERTHVRRYENHGDNLSRCGADFCISCHSCISWFPLLNVFD